ncbi:cytochrome P450 CYP749A22-like [Tripterygium wilfordii]|uniref:cytochrome P450 CYP749A22-like n=1 Tax=Tripterygium wilfordii TaxID=458696 RepID=UPI0018F82477|nr:cytochrome P450 CYP749A22-like [Tripterygium wilfordii]
MSDLGSLVPTLIVTPICVYLLFMLFKFLNVVLWNPIRIQKLMASQGIKGPAYTFIHGNMKQMKQMQSQSMATPLGLSHHILPWVEPHYCSWINSFGKNFLFWFGPEATLYVSEGELVKEILNNKEKSYPKRDLALHVKKLIGNSVAALFEGEQWTKMRKLANHAFRGETLRNLTPEIIASTEMMLQRWKNHKGCEIEVHEEFKLLTSEVISRSAFGSSYEEGKDIFHKLQEVTNIATRPPSLFFWFNGISKMLGADGVNDSERLVQEIRSSILEIIRKRENKVMTGEAESYGRDFLGLLLQSCHDVVDDESKRTTVDDVIDECKGMYFAGQETTTNLLSWAVMLLAIHPEWQEEARKEVQNMFGNQTPSSDGISKLKIMSMIINETLRLYPPALAVIIRKINRKVILGNLTLPPNLNIYLPIVKFHHDPEIWGEDVHQFKPERFSQGIPQATNNNPTAFFPFGIGPRTCVGSNFAVTEAKVALTMILQRYSFKLSPAYVHSPVQVLILRPQHGVQIILEPLMQSA